MIASANGAAFTGNTNIVMLVEERERAKRGVDGRRGAVKALMARH